MSIRNRIIDLQKLGKLPNDTEDDHIPIEYFERFGDILDSIKKPITIEEAKLLIMLFPDESCYGMEWTLLHLIESTPSWPIWKIIDMCPSSEWKKNMKERTGNS